MSISIKKGKTFEELYGEKRAKEIKEKLRQIKQLMKGRKITWKDKISEALKGRKLSEKHIKKLKEVHKK